MNSLKSFGFLMIIFFLNSHYPVTHCLKYFSKVLKKLNILNYHRNTSLQH